MKATGRIDLEELEKAMTKETSLVSIMMVNNEIGVVQPVKEIGELCRSKKASEHHSCTSHELARIDFQLPLR